MRARRRRRTDRSTWPRVVAAMLLASVCGLTCTPACGSPMDVDPVNCCQRHDCSPSGGNSTESIGGMKPGAKKSCCPDRHQNLSSSHNAEDCCSRGRLTYPSVQVQTAWSASALAAHAQALVATNGAGFAAGSSPAMPLRQESPPPKTSSLPLYTLNSSFRI